MQKNNKKASILIWSIMLSMIISIAFISLSIKIQKNLWENKKIQTENISKSLELNYEITKILKTEFLSKEKDYIVSLKKDEQHIIKTKSWTINLEVKDGIISYSTWSQVNLLNWNISLDFDNEANLKVKNVWWYAKVKITWDFQKDFEKYKIYKKIWNKIVEKTTWKK